MRGCEDARTHSNAISQCKLIHHRAGVTPHMLRSWSEGTERASFAQVLRLCGVLEISATELL